MPSKAAWQKVAETYYRQQAEQIVNLLNEAARLDPRAVEQLIEYRVPANSALASHAHIICSVAGGSRVVGLLGLLNGLLDTSICRVAVGMNIDRNPVFSVLTPVSHPDVFGESPDG